RPPENPLFIEENKWRATRYGLDARLHDFSTGRSATAREVVRHLVKALRPVSQDLGCEAELEGVLDILEAGTGAERQRAVFTSGGSTRAVIEYLVASTA
ncbi:MAG: carboxylate-amine ligase, partial [Actinomycetota bacterium]|nr:carboxylate-amine ligase [Actinomycetota bacterium]